MGTALIIVGAIVLLGLVAYFLIEPNRRERAYERELKERLGPEASPHELPEVDAEPADTARSGRFERESERERSGQGTRS